MRGHYIINQRGFTLVELMVVSLILSLMGGVLYGTLNGILQGKQFVEQERQTTQVAQRALERMIRELSGWERQTVTVRRENTEQQQAELNERDSIQATNSFFIGENEQNSNNASDSITFVSASAAQPMFGGLANYGAVQVQYRLEKNTEEDEEELKDAFVLVREEMPAGISTKEVIEKRTIRFPLAYRVRSLNFRYLVNSKWQDQWSQNVGQIPQAIEITLKLIDSKGFLRKYRTAVSLQRTDARSNQTAAGQVSEQSGAEQGVPQ